MARDKTPPKPPRLDRLDMSARLGAKPYEKRLAKLQHRLMQVQQAYLLSGRNAVIVFEGWDAAGKGGTIRRISAALDPRSFKVWPVGPPRDYHLDRHYLTRFFERLPPRGAITVFDRARALPGRRPRAPGAGRGGAARGAGPFRAARRAPRETRGPDRVSRLSPRPARAPQQGRRGP